MLGETIKTLSDREVYDYLGVSIAPNTGKQVKRKHCHERLREVLSQIEKLTDSGLLPWQVQDAIKTYILPRLVYSLNQLEINAGELDRIDSAVRKALKDSLDLPSSAPSAFFHASPIVGGLGMPEVKQERKIFMISTWMQLLSSEDDLLRAMAWREVEQMRNDAKVLCFEDAEYRTNSKECPHFLDWKTEADGRIVKSNKGSSNHRLTELTRSLASLGCQIKKTVDNNVVLYCGSMPVGEEVSRTLRGIYREKLAASWQRGTTGSHINLAMKAHLGNWWIANPRYLSASDYRFACRVRVNCLPVQANIAKWNKGAPNLCPLCQAHKGTQKHMLCGCEKLFPRYTIRHNKMVEELQRSLKRKWTVLRERGIKGLPLRPDLTIPEGTERGVYLDVGVTGGETLDGSMMKVIKSKTKKYANQKGMRFVDGKEQESTAPFRFIPVIFTPTGLYRPGLYFDLRSILKLSKRATSTLLKRLSAIAIRESRLIWHAKEE